MNDRFRAIERTASRAALHDGEAAAARLITRSGLAHLAAISLAAFVALSLSVGALPQPAPAALGGVALLFLAALLVGVLYATRAAAPMVCLLAAALCLGILLGSGDGPLIGAGIPFAAGAVSAEGLALFSLAVGRRRLAAPLSLLAPALTTTALVYALDGGPHAVSAGALVAGAAVATVLTLHARLAEDVLPERHGTAQWAAAAHSRWAEGARVLILRVLERSAEYEGFEKEP